MKTAPKWLIRGALALLALCVVAAAGTYIWLRGSLPDIDGERVLPGLAAPVEVIRDRHGVPRILAGSEDDALFALGFVHAQDRMWQMEMNRRIGAGRRLAEVLGSAALGTDRLVRVMGLRRRAAASLAQLEPDSIRRLEAYVRGVNSWLETRKGPLPPEFLILGVEPAQWDAVDSATWLKVMGLDLAREWTRDRMRLRLSETLSADRILDFYTPYRSDKPRGVVPSSVDVTTAPAGRGGGSADAWHVGRPAFPGTDGEPAVALDTMAADHSMTRLLAALPADSGHSGSNSWVVDGTRSATGKPILANDPHLGLTTPSIWYLAHLSWPGRDIVGATMPGLPVVVLGHNGRAAWGFTNTGPDVQDLFIEKVDPSNPSALPRPGRLARVRGSTRTNSGSGRRGCDAGRA